jgi:hypothetical protein
VVAHLEESCVLPFSQDLILTESLSLSTLTVANASVRDSSSVLCVAAR